MRRLLRIFINREQQTLRIYVGRDGQIDVFWRGGLMLDASLLGMRLQGSLEREVQS